MTDNRNPDIHISFIQQTYQLARSAAANNNHPFGALLVYDNEIILEAENTVNSQSDVTGHAELNLIRMASQQFPLDVLSSSRLYASTEPCAMCSGAIYWAGISTLIYGCSAQGLATVIGEDFLFSCNVILERGERQVEIIGPLLEAEGIELHRQHW